MFLSNLWTVQCNDLDKRSINFFSFSFSFKYTARILSSNQQEIRWYLIGTEKYNVT